MKVAAQNGHLEVVRLLVDNKADVNAADQVAQRHAPCSLHSSAIHPFACAHSHRRCALFQDGNTPIIPAAEFGHLAVVGFLMDKEAAINAANHVSWPSSSAMQTTAAAETSLLVRLVLKRE